MRHGLYRGTMGPVVALHPIFVDAFGDHERALFHQQLSYWQSERPGQWVVATDEQFYATTRLSPRQLRRCRQEASVLEVDETTTLAEAQQRAITTGALLVYKRAPVSGHRGLVYHYWINAEEGQRRLDRAEAALLEQAEGKGLRTVNFTNRNVNGSLPLEVTNRQPFRPKKVTGSSSNTLSKEIQDKEGEETRAPAREAPPTAGQDVELITTDPLPATGSPYLVEELLHADLGADSPYPRLAAVCRWVSSTYGCRTFTMTDTARFKQVEAMLERHERNARALGRDWLDVLQGYALRSEFQTHFVEAAQKDTYTYTTVLRIIEYGYQDYANRAAKLAAGTGPTPPRPPDPQADLRAEIAALEQQTWTNSPVSKGVH